MFMCNAAFVSVLSFLLMAKASILNVAEEDFPDIHPCDGCFCKPSEICKLNGKGGPVCLRLEDTAEQSPRLYDSMCKNDNDGEEICLCRSKCECEKTRKVCGSDGRTYPSHCTMHRIACESKMPIRMMHLGMCNREASAAACPTKITHPPNSDAMVYLNANALVQSSMQISVVDDLLIWSKLKKFDSSSMPASLLRALQVLDALEVISLRRHSLGELLQDQSDDVISLPYQSPVNRSAAILDAIEAIHAFNGLKSLPTFDAEAFNNSIVLSCQTEGANSVVWSHDGVEVKNGPRHQYLSHNNGLLIANVRPIDGGVYTCTAIGNSCNASASSFVHVRALYPDSPLPSYVQLNLNRTDLYGQYPALRLMDANAVNVTLFNFSSPHLEFVNSSLRNVTFVNVTIDSLVLSNVTAMNFTFINVTIGAVSYSDCHLHNHTIFNSTILTQNQSNPAKATFPNAWIRFFHITDIHMSLAYNELVDTSPTYCQPGITATVAPYKAPYGRPGCDSPTVLVDNFLDSLTKTDSEPNVNADFILVTGDFSGHGGQLVFKSMTRMALKLKAEFPTKYVFPALGNNDLPEDYYVPTPPRKWFASVLAIWSPLILCKRCSLRSGVKPTTKRQLAKTFLAGGYYKVSLSDKITMLLLNTNYFSAKAKAVTNQFLRDGENQLKWLAKELAKAEKSGKKVIIAGHIPPGVDPFGFPEFWKKNATEVYVDITANRYPHVIVGQLFAHMHKETYRVLFADMKNPTLKKSSPLLFSSAVSPVYNNNPNYRLMFLDNEKQIFTDFIHWYLDLAIANQYNKTNWNRQYVFSEMFPSKLGQVMNSERFLEIIDGIIDPNQSQTWLKYVWNSPALYLPSSDIFSRFLMHCVMKYWDENAFAACKNRLPFIPG